MIADKITHKCMFIEKNSVTRIWGKATCKKLAK